MIRKGEPLAHLGSRARALTQRRAQFSVSWEDFQASPMSGGDSGRRQKSSGTVNFYFIIYIFRFKFMGIHSHVFRLLVLFSVTLKWANPELLFFWLNDRTAFNLFFSLLT